MTPNCIKRIVVIFKTREIFSRTFRGVTGASGEITQLLSVDDRVSTSDAAVRGKMKGGPSGTIKLVLPRTIMSVDLADGSYLA